MNKRIIQKSFEFFKSIDPFKFALLTIIISPIISTLLFLFASLKSTFKNFNKYFKDKINIIFTISGLLMVLSLIKNSLIIDTTYKTLITRDNWFDLFNWIPFFLLFFFFQHYLSSQKKRKEVALIFLIGSSPLVFIGLCQAWLGLPGIYFNFIGTIKFIPYSGDFITGVFNNPNINGLWLALMVPFLVGFLKSNRSNFHTKLVLTFLFVGIIICIFFTYSRLAFLSLFLGSLLFLSKKGNLNFYLIFLIPLLLINFLKLFSDKLVNFFIFGIYPLIFVRKFSLSFDQIVNSPRIKIWTDSLSLISKKPIFGWGPLNFSTVYENNNLTYYAHSHNLPIELAFNYGIICSLIISCTILYLFFRSFVFLFKKENFNNNYLFDRAWFLASLITFTNHLIDIQYFDGRISVISWILMAGLKCILDENKNSNTTKPNLTNDSNKNFELL